MRTKDETRILMVAAQSHLLPDQEIMLDLDDPLVACISNGVWKTRHHPVKQLADGILKWRIDRKTIQSALPFLNPEEREFLMTGFTPSDWSRIFKSSNDNQQGEVPF